MENNQVRVFENTEFGKVRTIVKDGEPWFVAVDVCNALDIGNPSQAISRLDDDEKVTLTTNEGHSGKLGGAQMLNVISEAGLYSLILKSRKPEAKAFKRWITHEVIPTIRKTGGYVANDDLFISTYLPSADDATKLLFKTTLETMRNLNEQNEKLKQEVEYKENVIVGLVKDIDLADKRQRITQIVRKGQGNGSAISARYALLYSEFEKKYHVNLSVRLENYRSCYKPNLKNNLDLIDRQMNMIPELYEICCKLFENEYNEIMKTWQSAINTENVG